MKPCIIVEQSDITDPIMKAISKYKHHPSILLINSRLSSPESLSFNQIRNFDMEKGIKLLNIKNAATFKNVPPKIKSSTHSCSESLANFFNNIVINSEFPEKLKLADLTATFTKEDPTEQKETINW